MRSESKIVEREAAKQGNRIQGNSILYLRSGGCQHVRAAAYEVVIHCTCGVAAAGMCGPLPHPTANSLSINPTIRLFNGLPATRWVLLNFWTMHTRFAQKRLFMYEYCNTGLYYCLVNHTLIF